LDRGAGRFLFDLIDGSERRGGAGAAALAAALELGGRLRQQADRNSTARVRVSAVCALQDFELAGWCSLSLGGAAPSAAPDYARAGGHGAADSFLVLSGGGRRGRAMGSASPTAGLQQHGEGYHHHRRYQ
jgi:hypothetical protein